MEPLLTNDRARREWAWLVAQVGDQTARDAIARLPGNRKPYPLNVARVLGLTLPDNLASAPPAPPDVVRERLAELKRIVRA